MVRAWQLTKNIPPNFKSSRDRKWQIHRQSISKMKLNYFIRDSSLLYDYIPNILI